MPEMPRSRDGPRRSCARGVRGTTRRRSLTGRGPCGSQRFSRAWRFLNYRPVAKWTALAAAVVTGLLYIAFLFVLGLFADLMVTRGQIPAFRDLSESDRVQFQKHWDEL